MTQQQFLVDDRPHEDVQAIDELFASVATYRRSKAYFELIQFIGKFTRYSPYNAFLLHVQNPKVSFVATTRQWKKRHGRLVKPDARPLVILAPRGPVAFVYDLADTEGRPLPQKLLDPFAAIGEVPPRIIERTAIGALKDGILVMNHKEFSTLQAGAAQRLVFPLMVTTKKGEVIKCPFRIDISTALAPNARYATLVHELGHIYSGHLGALKEGNMPVRSLLSDAQVEIEAETISYLVCKHMGIRSKSEEYLALKASQDIELPPVSLNTILKVAGQVLGMANHDTRLFTTGQVADNHAKNL